LSVAQNRPSASGQIAPSPRLLKTGACHHCPPIEANGLKADPHFRNFIQPYPPLAEAAENPVSGGVSNKIKGLKTLRHDWGLGSCYKLNE